MLAVFWQGARVLILPLLARARFRELEVEACLWLDVESRCRAVDYCE